MVCGFLPPPGRKQFGSPHGRCLVFFEIRKFLKKIKKCSNFKILGCSGRSLALIGGSFAVPKSSLLPGKCFSEPSKIAFLDVGSLRISARHRPNALSSQMRTVRLVGSSFLAVGAELPSRRAKPPSRAELSRAEPSQAERPRRAEPTARPSLYTLTPDRPPLAAFTGILLLI